MYSKRPEGTLAGPICLIAGCFPPETAVRHVGGWPGAGLVRAVWQLVLVRVLVWMQGDKEHFCSDGTVAETLEWACEAAYLCNLLSYEDMKQHAEYSCTARIQTEE